MAGRGLGDGVVLMGIGEDDALAREPGKPAIEGGAVAIEVVAPELVDADQHLEPRRARCVSGERDDRGEPQGHAAACE